MIKRIAALFLALILTQFAFAKQEPLPQWIMDIHTIYNDAEYVAECGEGANEEIAKSDALSRIASYLQTTVNSQGVSVTSVNGSAYSMNAIKKVTVESSADLFGVEYETFYYKKKKKYYCAAYINREKYWQQIQPKIELKKHGFRKFYDEAEKMNRESEPILARKYFILSKKAGEDFLNELSISRLIAREFTNIYSHDEKKVAEIEKNIKDAENSIAIFIEIRGDYANKIQSNVQSLFESEKYSFTGNKKNCSHIMTIEIEPNKDVSHPGTDDEITSVVPSMTLTLTNPYMKQNLFSFTRKADKGIAYTQEKAMDRGYNNLCTALECDLLSAFQEKMLEE